MIHVKEPRVAPPYGRIVAAVGAARSEEETMSTTHTTLRAEGFSCPSCVAKIEKSLAALPGVSAATVHFASSRIEARRMSPRNGERSS